MATMTEGNISITTNNSWSHNAITRGKIGTITNNSANTIIITSLTFQFGSGIGKFWDEESQQLQSQSRTGETITTMTLLIESGDGSTWQSQIYKNGITSSFKDSSGATIQLNATTTPDSNGAYGYIPQATRKKMPAYTFTFNSAPEIPANATYTIYFRIPTPLNGNPQPVLIFNRDGIPAGTWHSIVSYDTGGIGLAPSADIKKYQETLILAYPINELVTVADEGQLTYNYNYDGKSNEIVTFDYKYQWDGWKDRNDETLYWAYDEYEYDAGTVMDAVWRAPFGEVELKTNPKRPGKTVSKATIRYANADQNWNNKTSLLSRTINYRFDGWYRTYEDKTGLHDYKEVGTYSGPSTTLVAHWGEIISDDILEDLTEDPPPTKEHYNFIGWSESENGPIIEPANYSPSGDITLYANWTPIQRTISYKDSSGQVLYTDKADSGTKVTLKKDGFSRSGYDLVGWSSGSSGSPEEDWYDLGEEITLIRDMILYPRWNKTNYEIIIDPYEVEGLIISIPQVQKAPWGVIRTLSATLKEGYTFVKWDFNPKTDIDSLTTLNATFTMPQYNIIITPVVEKITYTITYKPGRYGSGSVQTQTKSYGINVTLKKADEIGFSRTGHTQIGWSTTNSGSAGSNYAADGTGIYSDNANITLYPVWKKNTYTISYNNGGYGTAPNSQTKYYNTDLTVRDFIENQQTDGGPQVHFNPNGGHFTPTSITATRTASQRAWKDSEGSEYTKNTKYTKNKENLLTAQWNFSNNAIKLANAVSKNNRIDQYTITYNTNGGDDNAPSNQTLKKSVPQIFSGWKYNNTIYAAGAQFTPSNTTIMQAQWSDGTATGSITLAGAIDRSPLVENAYTVTLETDYGFLSEKTLISKKTTNYNFVGWAKNSPTGYTYSATATYSAPANVTLYAKWGQTQSYSSVTLPPLSHTGYTFKGWSTVKGSTRVVSNPYKPMQDTTLYAVWERKTYNITYAPGDYGVEQSVTVSKLHGIRFYIESNPLFTHKNNSHEQIGWTTSPTGSGGNVFTFGQEYLGNAPLTLYPLWSEKYCYITYKPGRYSNEQDAVYYQTKWFTKPATIKSAAEIGFTYDDHHQIRWSTNGSGLGGTNYASDGTGIYDKNEDITLYPIWKKNPQFILDPSSNVSTEGSTQSGYYLAGTLIELKATPHLGYEFVRWESSIPNIISHITEANGFFNMPEKAITMTPIVKPKGIVGVNVNNEWKMAIPYIFSNNKWNMAIPYVFKDTLWKMAGPISQIPTFKFYYTDEYNLYVYTAETDMTWNTWINSNYNTDGFYQDRGMVYDGYDNPVYDENGNHQLSSTVIQSGASYYYDYI